MPILRNGTVFRIVLAALLPTTPLIAQAQVSTHITYEDHIKNARKFAALDETLFGDKINLQDGAVSFAYDDVALSTNSGLRVMIGRKTPTRIETNTPQFNVFGHNWDLNVPYMMGTYDSRDGWNAGEGVATNGWGDPSANMNRCTSGAIRPRERLGPSPYYNTQPIYAHMYWKGVHINVPGYGQEQMLKPNASQVMPTNGTTYYGTTKSSWKVSCLSSIKNDVGEGFKVTLPDGVTYHFDWMVKRKAVDLTDNGNTDSQGNGTDPWHLLAPLTDVYLYATKAVDRFGNTVTYTYDTTYPNRIKTIESNDGVRLDVQYNAGGLISSVTAENRTWLYAYNGKELTSFQLPDASKWTFSGSFNSVSASPETVGFWSNSCGQNLGNMNAANPPDTNSLSTLTITHPSGAKGDFTFRPLYHGINNAPGGCGPLGSQQTGFSYGTYGVPSKYGVVSLYAKKISGPGISDRTWNYSYAPSWSFQSQCNSGCASTSSTAVTTNDGVTRRYTYGNDYFLNHGQLLAETTEKNNVVVRSRQYTYVSTATAQPFPDNAGDIPQASGLADLYGNPFKFKNRPLKTVINQQDSVTFNRTNATYDVFARSLSVQKSNSLGYTKTDITEYHDNLNLWVLGQVKREYTLNTEPNGQVTTSAMLASDVEYNAQALPWKTYRFGKLQQTITYAADGRPSTVTDARNNTTLLSNWKRGIPGQIQYPPTPEAPAGAIESADVDNNGWIRSITNPIGAKTCYGYDAMGRLSSIVYPSETQPGVCDTSRWNQTTIATEFITTPEHGIAAGHWRTSTGTGGGYINVYYDAMLRPVLEESLDLNNIAGTLSQVVKRYDSSGRLSFQSYPTNNVDNVWDVTQGVRTFYDALDRTVRVEQDSELGTLATGTEYLSGLQVRTTNPRNQQTTTSFMAWDQPGYDLPILSQQPEGKTIQIGRHPQFGWPLALTQRNAANTLSQTRRYVYDGNAQLCKTIEPETGATVTGYDAAGNPVWSAAGLTGGDYANALDCSYAAANASGRVVNRIYDPRNRVSQLQFPDGRGNQVLTYTPDGLTASITTYNGSGNTTPVVNAYNYNYRRILTGESINQTGWYTWSIGYGYNANAHLSLHAYPTGLTVDYAPNNLGQPTKAGTFASGAQYYPNGGLKQFTYGNGIVHTMTQNERQLPRRVTSSGGVLDYTYYYDANGNPEHIANELVNGYDPRDRWMTYDGLDRLTDAGSASFGGDHWHRFTYDALDNMTSWKLAGVKDYAQYVYDAKNHLTNIRNTAGSTVIGLDYDDQGNLSNKNGQVYDFDYGNRLRTVAGKEAYRYDGLGRRVQTTMTDGSQTTLWQYSQTGQMLFSSKWNGATYLNHTTQESVYLGGSLIATIDHDWPSNAITAVKYQHTDALGSPVAVTNTLGQVIERNDYEPYGAIIGKPTRSGIGYTGHMMDGVTGLTYMQQRYYDQSVGRFLSVDPVMANSGSGVNFNRYWYANNNPYKFVDPDGRWGEVFDRAKYDKERSTAGATSASSKNDASGSQGATAADGLVSIVHVQKDTVETSTTPWGDPTSTEKAAFAILQDLLEFTVLTRLKVPDTAAGVAVLAGTKSFLNAETRVRVTTVVTQPWIGTYEQSLFGGLKNVNFQGLGPESRALIKLERQTRFTFGDRVLYTSGWENQALLDNTHWLKSEGMPLHDVP